MSRWEEVRSAVFAFMFGAALSWVAVPYRLRHREGMTQMLALDLYLDLVGLSPIPASRRLWLLPYVVPQILSWHRRWRLWDDSLETANLAHIGH